MGTKLVHITFRAPEEERRDFKTCCAAEGSSHQEVLRKLMRQHVRKHKDRQQQAPRNAASA